MSEKPKRVILLTPRMIDSIVRQLNALPVPRKHTPPPVTRKQSLRAWGKLTLSMLLVPNPVVGYIRLALIGIIAAMGIAANVVQLVEFLR